MRAYSSGTHGLYRSFGEAVSLYRIRTQTASTRIHQLIDEARTFESIIECLCGLPPENKSILEVGPGHYLAQAYYFARKNKVTTIDTDVIPVGFAPLQYISLLVHNGLQRTIKTIVRKASGIDAQHRRYLKEQLCLLELPPVRILRDDVCHMRFVDSSFDVVFCRSVLHHISDPAVALGEITRVLRPGGVAIVNLHLYTSHNGSLDPRVMSGTYDDAFLWAHLRPEMAEDFRGNAFLNKLRLDDWRKVLSSAWPGCTIKTESSSREGILESAQMMVESGVIFGYTIEELTTHTVLSFWRKPI